MARFRKTTQRHEEEDVFDEVLGFTLAREGGFSHAQGDRGGRTQYGISETFHPDAWKDGPPTLDDAKAIYQRDYWSGIAPLARVLPGTASALFDYQVHGSARRGSNAIQVFQVLVGVEPDGIVGPKTVGAALEAADVALGEKLGDVRRRNLVRLTENDPRVSRFRRGWLRRLDLLGGFLNELHARLHRRREQRHRERDRGSSPDTGAPRGDGRANGG